MPPVTAQTLRRRRLALQLSQRDLAERLGVAENTLARWERGELGIARPEWLDLALSAIETAQKGGRS